MLKRASKFIHGGGIAAMLMSGVLAGEAAAQDDYPARPIQIIVNTAPGGLTDLAARLVAEKMGQILDQSVVVENRAGGDGVIGAVAVKNAAPDGHTVLVSAGTLAIQPAVKSDPGYDLAEDFRGIGPIVRTPLMMVVGANQPDQTLADFVARAKVHPEQFSYASAGMGTTTHLGAAMFMRAAGLDILHMPYKGNGAAMPDVMAGRVNTIFEAYNSGASKVEEGLLRPLAVTSSQRLPAMPDLPTFAEQGYPDYSYYLYIGMLAPKATPDAVVEKLSGALNEALADPELQQRFRDGGAEVMPMAADEFTTFVNEDAAEMVRLVEELGIQRQ